MSDFDPAQFPAAQPHDPIQQVAPDIFFVGATFRMNPVMNISRNMVIVRTGRELTLLNPIRLSAAGEKALEALGAVKHVVRLGAFHGYDDAYVVKRFNAEFWCQPGSDHYAEPKPDHELKQGGPLPIPDAELFEFTEIKKPECAMLIRRGNGLLVVCDGLQHYGDFSRHSIVAKLVMPLLGFARRMLVGPIWLKYLTKKGRSVKPDFERMLDLDFDALISAHGTPLMQGAKAAVRMAVDKANFEVK
jgi:hypothetical protein